jgi:F-type H+-transporting ATPase subunit b
MLKEAKDTKDKIINEAKEQAKVEANRIFADANQALENQKMAALTDVKNQIGNMVIEVSEKVIRKELANKSDQEVYIRTLAEDLQSLRTRNF